MPVPIAICRQPHPAVICGIPAAPRRITPDDACSRNMDTTGHAVFSVSKVARGDANWADDVDAGSVHYALILLDDESDNSSTHARDLVAGMSAICVKRMGSRSCRSRFPLPALLATVDQGRRRKGPTTLPCIDSLHRRSHLSATSAGYIRA